ncbi:MAG: tRNA dihydrouridine synthase DusB [Candidatus Omnitrophica bacterium]|nr:tRNA dihydrouridine synthase DusB [Candidatus Omnitrophota bacterium]
MKIGDINLDKPLCLAPMEDVTDLSFRRISRELGADIVYTEFTSSEALIRDIPKALRKIKICDEERPVGIQIYGGVEASMEGAARVAESFNPNFIDINCGCWVKNHVQRCECAGLLRDIPQFERIVKATMRGTKLPVTVKTRLGWDDNSIVIVDVAKMLESIGVAALTIHCRTRVQGYKGLADWRWLEKIRKAISIPLIGNGDVATAYDVRAMLETGCDAVMIGRGAIMNPFLFREAKYYLATGEMMPPASLEERVKLCLRHLELSIQYKGLNRGIIEFRKYYVGYFHGQPNIAKLRADLMQMTDLEIITKRLYQYLDEHVLIAV